jgi:hypothetical protein
MSITGRAATTVLPLIAGNFQADMTLSGAAAPTNKVLGTATIKGAASGDWMLTAGNTGIINAGSTTGGFTLGAAGLVAGFNTTAADMLGDLTANKFTAISAKGNFGAGIHITGDPARQDTTIGTLKAGTMGNLVLDIAGSIGTMTMGVVTDVSMTLSGGITTMTVTEWNNADGLADKVTAGWIGTMKTVKNAALPAVQGDFEASLELTGVGAPLGKALGTATVAGSVTSTNADASRLIWNVAGQTGAVTIGGAVDALTAHATKSMTSFQAGAVNDAELTVDDALGSAKALCWNAGKIEADKIGTLSITGRAATTLLPAVAGDFGADLTIRGLNVTTGPLLATATIAHDVTGGTWTIGDEAMGAFTGNTVTTITVNHDVTDGAWMIFGGVGTININGTAANSMVRASGTITALNLGATNGSEFQAGVTADKASADMVVGDVDPAAAIKTINVKGWSVPTSQPQVFFVENSSFLAGQFGTVSFINADGIDSFTIYVPDPATDVKSVKNTDNRTPANSWTWPSANWVGRSPVTAIGAVADTFAGSFPVTALQDNNIQDGVAIIQQKGTIGVVGNGAGDYTVTLTNTLGQGMSFNATQGLDANQIQSDRLVALADSNLVDFVMVSDGQNMAMAMIGQETYDPTDISLTVTSWTNTPWSLPAADWVGTWDASYYSDPNLRDTAEGFTSDTMQFTITRVGTTNTLIVATTDGSAVQATLSGNTIKFTGSLVVGGSRWHALQASSDGTGMSFVAVTSEIADPADVSVILGLATRA